MRNTTTSLGPSCLIATACLLYAGMSAQMSFPTERAEIGYLSLAVLALSLISGMVLHALSGQISRQLGLRQGWLASLLGLTTLLVQIAACLILIDDWPVFG